MIDMNGRTRLKILVGCALAVLAGCRTSLVLFAQPVAVAPATMPRVGTIDERFQSFNIEMVEVTGGRFWAPYKAKAATAPTDDRSAPAGMDPSAFRYRSPINLANPRLRKLAASERNVGEFDFLSGFGWSGSGNTACGLQQCSDTAAVAGSG
jgi:heparanase 1